MSKSNRSLTDLSAFGYEPKLTPKKLESLDRYERFCYEKAGGDQATDPSDEQSYFLGAFHAFEDTLDLLYTNDSFEELPEEEKRKLSVKTKLVITAVIITGGVYVAPKIEEKFQIKSKFYGVKETVAKELKFIAGAFRA